MTEVEHYPNVSLKLFSKDTSCLCKVNPTSCLEVRLINVYVIYFASLASLVKYFGDSNQDKFTEKNSIRVNIIL